MPRICRKRCTAGDIWRLTGRLRAETEPAPLREAGVVTTVTRDAANLVATERARQSACANEGADKLSGGPGDRRRRPCLCPPSAGSTYDSVCAPFSRVDHQGSTSPCHVGWRGRARTTVL